MTGMSKISAKYLGDLRTEGELKNQTLSTDVVEKFGGLEEYPTPTDYFVYSLATCMLTMIGLKARALGIDVEGTTVTAEKVLDETGKIIGFNIAFQCPKSVEETQAEKLEKSATHCPIHQALHSDIELEVEFQWENQSSSSSKQG